MRMMRGAAWLLALCLLLVFGAQPFGVSPQKAEAAQGSQAVQAVQQVLHPSAFVPGWFYREWDVLMTWSLTSREMCCLVIFTMEPSAA